MPSKADEKERAGCLCGCDICQEVCPFNRDTPASGEKQFYPPEQLLNLCFGDLVAMTEPQFKQLFSDTSVARLSYQQFRRNLQALQLTY